MRHVHTGYVVDPGVFGWYSLEAHEAHRPVAHPARISPKLPVGTLKLISPSKLGKSLSIWVWCMTCYMDYARFCNHDTIIYINMYIYNYVYICFNMLYTYIHTVDDIYKNSVCFDIISSLHRITTWLCTPAFVIDKTSSSSACKRWGQMPAWWLSKKNDQVTARRFSERSHLK